MRAAEPEAPAAVKKTPGKRAMRHRRLDAFDAFRAPSDTVYMGNLFYDITAEDLRKHMEQYGTVLKTVIVHDNRGISKGYGQPSTPAKALAYENTDSATSNSARSKQHKMPSKNKTCKS